MAAGRNDPCPCGSGLKYKKCHLPMDEAARPVANEEHRSPLHELDNRFVLRVVSWAQARFAEFDPDDIEDAFPEIVAGGFEFLVPWSVYHYRVQGLPTFEWYARENEAILSRRERDWIEAQRRSWMSVWEVRECAPGRSMVLADLLTGERRLVQEAKASRELVVNDAILTRVVDLGADSILVGTHQRPLAPMDAADVVDRLRRHLRAKLPLPPERLREEDVVLALAWQWREAVEERLRRLLEPPNLRNADGDPVRFVTDRYRFIESTRDAVEAALSSIKGAVLTKRLQNGTSVLAFFKQDDRSVGTAFVSADELCIETDSRRRAAALRRKVENACRGLLVHRQRTDVDPWEMPADEETEVDEPFTTAEDVAIVREVKAEKYAAWPDEPLPFLDGKTPRQAARSRRGRERLALLLKEMENREAHQDAATRFDFSILRRELGIEEST